MLKKKNKGLFITFEGPDGSGKTTVIKAISNYLKKKFPKKILTTREPGGKNNPIAEDIRNIILNKPNYKITPITETLLFAASRAQHINDFIKPNLKKNKIILCDRFIHSSLIYQGIARGVGFNTVQQINKYAIGKIKPDLTFLLLVKPTIGLQRIKNNTQREYNRLDNETINVHQKVYNGYLKIIKTYPKNLKVIDASKPLKQVINDVKKILNTKINKYYGK